MKIEKINCEDWEDSDEYVENWLLSAKKNEIRLFSDSFLREGWVAFIIKDSDTVKNGINEFIEEYLSKLDIDIDQFQTEVFFEIYSKNQTLIKTVVFKLVPSWNFYIKGKDLE